MSVRTGESRFCLAASCYPLLGTGNTTSEHLSRAVSRLTAHKPNDFTAQLDDGVGTGIDTSTLPILDFRFWIQEAAASLSFCNPKSKIQNPRWEALCKHSGKTCATVRECCSSSPASL
jgi:hypothetical protein